METQLALAKKEKVEVEIALNVAIRGNEELEQMFRDVRLSDFVVCKLCAYAVRLKSDTTQPKFRLPDELRPFTHNTSRCRHFCVDCYESRPNSWSCLSHRGSDCNTNTDTFPPCKNCGAGERRGTFCNHEVSECPFVADKFRVSEVFPPCENCGAGEKVGFICNHSCENCIKPRDYYRKGKGKGKKRM